MEEQAKNLDVSLKKSFLGAVLTQDIFLCSKNRMKESSVVFYDAFL